MSKKISYIKWRSNIEDITPADHRIGDDILLIDNSHTMRAELSSDNEPFRIDMTMAIIYEQGSADLKINMRDYHIEAPAVLLVLNDQIYQSAGHSEDLRSKVILMSRSFSDSLFANSGEILPLKSSIMKNPVMKIENEENVFGQFFQLLQNIAASPRQEFKIESARHLTLSMFYGYSHLKHEVNEVKSTNSRQEEIFTKFTELLERHHKKEREIAFYADKMCMTSKHLSQVIKDYTGKTALGLIEEYVISEAKSMLLSTTMSIQQISDELKFPSQSVFGKYFKRVAGISPSEYRNRH
ncbi:MAG: AraC family transcriptional regulator [Bacteroidales bacterium]|nr:AraC family transcriptional regulator [Bacteroidales bacterium]